MKTVDRKTLVVSAVATAALLRAAVACGFPSPELVDLPDVDVPAAEAGEGGGPPLVVDASSDDGARLPEVAPFDGSVAPLDAQMIDGDATVVLGDGAVVNCDEDGDRFAKIGGQCGGLDCNDKEGLARPNQIFIPDDASPGDGAPGTGGDWNCNGTVEREFEVDVKESCPNLLGIGCARQGWEGQPRCGSVSRFITCTPAFLVGCSSSVEMRRVNCK